ncbi:MAG: nucleotide triphosphate diphosphatase NUDT15 [Candidatus Levyibacteriota bacterium]
MNDKKPIIGVGVIIENAQGKILIAKRKKKVPKYSITGGAVEVGETFEQAAIREVKEETNLTITNPQVIAVTNNLETYQETGWHTVSIILLAKEFSGTLQVMEPEKSEKWFWCDPKILQEPHFDASRLGVQCYLEKKFYIS